MKRVLSVIYTLILLVFVCLNSQSTTVQSDKVVYVSDIQETLLYPDYSLLYTCKEDKKNDTCLEVSVYDADVLMKIARAEGGPTLDGQLWTMRIIYNRLLDGSFGNSIWEVISADGQFDVFTDGSYINADVNSNSHIALAMIEGGWNETQGALYWRTEAGSKDSWHERNLTYIATVDGNRYYK